MRQPTEIKVLSSDLWLPTPLPLSTTHLARWTVSMHRYVIQDMFKLSLSISRNVRLKKMHSLLYYTILIDLKKKPQTHQIISRIMAGGVCWWHALCYFLLSWKAAHVDNFLPITASMYIDLPSYYVSAPLSWQLSHVMSLRSWQQCKSMILLRRRADPLISIRSFYDLELTKGKL